MEAKNSDERVEVHNHKKKNSIKDFFTMGEVGGYFFRGKDPSRPRNINLRMMHGINKFSIIVFIIGIIFLLIKRLF